MRRGPAPWRAALAAGLAAGLLAFAALPAAAQGRELARVRSAFPGGEGERIAALIEEAHAEGLPASLLVGKALEGARKRASPDRVLRAVSEYAEELREARAAVGQEVGDEALKEAADALRRGVPPSAIRSLAGTARGDLSILFVVMFDLMDAGVPAGPAEALVEDAVRRDVGGERLLSLPASVSHLIREGFSPAEAADSVRRTLGTTGAWWPGMRREGELAGVSGWDPLRPGPPGRGPFGGRRP